MLLKVTFFFSIYELNNIFFFLYISFMSSLLENKKYFILFFFTRHNLQRNNPRDLRKIFIYKYYLP